MVVAISAALLPDAGAPQVGVTVTGAPASPTPVVVETSWDGGATWAGVRGGKRVISGGDLFRDHIPALNVPVLYRVQAAGAWTVSAPVTIVSDTAWAQDPLNPRSAVPVKSVTRGNHVMLMAGSLGSVSRNQLADVVMVDGARLPVASIGMRRAPAGLPLTLRADVAAQGALVKAMRDLVNSSGQFVLRGLPPELGLDAVAHLIAPDVQQSTSFGGTLGIFEQWEMTVDQVRPTSLRISVPWWTYDHVRALWPSQSYNAVKATRPGSAYIDWKADPTP